MCGGETEMKMSGMLPLGNIQFSWELAFQKLEGEGHCFLLERRMNQRGLPGGSVI